MYKALKLTILLSFAWMCQFSAAQAVVEVDAAKYKFEDRRFADVFKQSLIFGHSVSSNLMRNLTKVYGSKRYGVGPGDILSKTYAEVPPMANIAEGVGTLETGLTKMSRWLNAEQDLDAKAGADRDINVMNRHFANSSVIIGIDALYMAASFNECADYGDHGVRMIIDRFVEKSYTSDKVLILGNVPQENRASFSPLAKIAVPAMNEHCRQVINQALKNSCTPSRNCYISNLEGLVRTLNSTGQLKLKDGTVLKDSPTFFGWLMGRRDVRPDGVNMSARGVQILVEGVLDSMAENPPHARIGWGPNPPLEILR